MKDLNNSKSEMGSMGLRIRRLATILKKAGGFDNSIFNGRLIFQKTIYILKKMGLKELPYTFSLYHNGPYCSSLADDGYKLAGLIKTPEPIELSAKEEELIHKFRTMIKGHENDPIWFESMGTSLFLIKSDHSLGKEDIFKALVSRHDYLGDRSIFENVWATLHLYILA